MSTINVNAIDKESGSTLTLGGAGTTVAVHASATTSGFDSGLASVQTFTSSGTWTRPTGITKVIVEVQGAGAGGNNGLASSAYSTGGSAGGYVKKLIDVSSISTATITIGAKGTGSATRTGNDGGDSIWSDGTNTLTGGGGSAGTSGGGEASGLGGSATGGDLNLTGGNASNSASLFAGGSFWGSGSVRRDSGGEPMASRGAYGTGGVAVYDAQSVDAPDGVVFVEEYK